MVGKVGKNDLSVAPTYHSVGLKDGRICDKATDASALEAGSTIHEISLFHGEIDEGLLAEGELRSPPRNRSLTLCHARDSNIREPSALVANAMRPARLLHSTAQGT